MKQYYQMVIKIGNGTKSAKNDSLILQNAFRYPSFVRIWGKTNVAEPAVYWSQYLEW
jgi:hypothetical protein